MAEGGRRIGPEGRHGVRLGFSAVVILGISLVAACTNGSDSDSTYATTDAPDPATSGTVTTPVVEPAEMLDLLGDQLVADAVACLEGAMAACNQLADGAPSILAVSRFGQSCGGRVTHAERVDCETLSQPGDPVPFRLEPEDENLATACESGDMDACDSLSDSTTAPLALVSFGQTCGSRIGLEAGTTCAAVATGSTPDSEPTPPEGVIDDILDGSRPLLEACREASDGQGLSACDGVQADTESPIQYRTWAALCGGRLEVAVRSCQVAFGYGAPQASPYREGSDELNALAVECEAGLWDACDELRQLALDADTAFDGYGRTCGGRADPLSDDSYCINRFRDLSQTYSTDFELDHFEFRSEQLPNLEACAGGDWARCDLLADASDVPLRIRQYGAACGGVREPSDDACESVFRAPWQPGEPDATMQEVIASTLEKAEACHTDSTACDDLANDRGSVASYGAACGGRREPIPSEPCPPPVMVASIEGADIRNELEEVFAADISDCESENLDACKRLTVNLGEEVEAYGAGHSLLDWAASCGRPQAYDPSDDCFWPVQPETSVAATETTEATTTSQGVTTTATSSLSAPDAPTTAGPPQQALQPPSAIHARYLDGIVRVEWAPSQVPRGGLAPVEYQVRVENIDDAGDSRTVSAGRQTFYEFTFGRPGSSYEFSVVAIAGHETIAAVDPSNVVTIPGLPSPRNVRARADGRTVVVEWTPPAGVSVTQYRVRAIDQDTGNVVDAGSSGDETSAVFNNLVPGRTYVFDVVAEMDGQPGDPSTPSAPLTIDKSASPFQLRVTTGTDGVTLSWQEPQQPTDPVREYEVAATHEDSSVEPTVRYVAGPPALLTDLEPGRWTFVVTPMTASGEGTPSPPVTGEVAAPTEPGIWAYVKGFFTDLRAWIIPGILAVWGLIEVIRKPRPGSNPAA